MAKAVEVVNGDGDAADHVDGGGTPAVEIVVVCDGDDYC